MVFIIGEKYMILSKKFWQQKTSFFIIILLLISSFSFVINEVNADSTSFNEEDGTYFVSSFEGISNENIFGGCVISDTGNKIMLDSSGSRYANYNFSNWNKDSENEVRRGEIFWFSPLFPTFIISAFEEVVTTANYYWAMSKNDSYEYPRDGKIIPTVKQQFHHFRFKISQDIDSISSFEIQWTGSAENQKNVKLYVRRPLFGFGIWQELDKVTTNETDLELSYQNESLPLDEDGYLELCVVVVPDLGEKTYIQTDFINVKVLGTGFAKSGAVRFEPVSAENISRWERFTWSGYEKEATSISAQFFHYDNGSYNLISNSIISGNSIGITKKSVDLSKVSIDTNLTVNFTLETTDIAYSPELYEWGVSWQLSDEYWMDQFDTELRVEESRLNNVRIKDGSATLVTTVYDWPMFGHDARNTRVSPGLGPGSNTAICWESLERVGGNQKNPIVNDGLIYIANEDSSKIYAYDAQYDQSFIPNEKEDASLNLEYEIRNSPVATSKNTIVVATGSSIDNGGIENKVYGLNANNLQTQEWKFSYDSVDSENPYISYEASPVIKDGKIYLTSWNGDSSLLTDVFDFFNLSTGNNKLICLTESGSYEWSTDLAAGSFASPAVSDDTIVAGCEKINGESLRAFTLDGSKKWGTDVGPIGYASPVIVDDVVYVVSKKLCQTFVNAFTQVVAVDLDSGIIKWNTTIGDMLPELYGNAAFSSPVVVNGMVYVASPDGIMYKIDADNGSILESKKIFNKGVSSLIIRSSPAYADEIIYIGTPNGYIYALDASTLNTVWSRKTDPTYPIYSSPIVVDGFLYYTDESNYLYCQGKHQIVEDTQITGTLISTPISLPSSSLYFKKFEVSDSVNSGYITYSVLKENYQELIEEIEDNDELEIDLLKDIDTIRLKAVFHANAKETVSLHSWKVTFDDEPGESGETIFRKYQKDLSDPPFFSIDVRNSEHGLINTSARFKLEYSNESTGTYITEWLPANFTGENRTKDEETISVNMSYYDVINEIDLYHQIKFSINVTTGKTSHSEWKQIEGKPDQEPPLFYLNSFSPDPPFISSMTPTCTIQAKDVGSNGNTTGLNVFSAHYSIEYNNGKTFTTRAECSGSNGTENKVTLTADISQADLDENITNLESIRFSIEDMDGNENETDWIDLFFDSTPPISSVSNTDDIPQFNNGSFVRINATATDSDVEDEYTSGVKEITLYYRKSGSTQWNQFGSPCSSDSCSWEFTIGATAGGEFELCTIALDNASNEESFPTEGDVFFVYDPNPPTVTFPDSLIEITNNSNPPSFDQVTFEDDYQLDKIYYRLNSDGIQNWTLITTTSQDKVTPTWNITKTQWDDMIEDETAYVFFKVHDALGNIFVITSTQNAMRIRKNIEDIVEYTVDVNDFDSWQFDNSYTIRVNTQNTSITSMKLWYRFAGETENTTANWTIYSNSVNATPFEWNFNPEDGEGYYQFYVEITTAEGLVKTTPVQTVFVTLFPLSELIVALVVTIILFAVSGLVIKKYRGHQKENTI